MLNWISTERLRPAIWFRGRKTSDYDETYNCVAWAFREEGNLWPYPFEPIWPVVLPEPVGENYELRAFQELFSERGWTADASNRLETGFDKIALFVRRDGEVIVPTHVARMVLEDDYGPGTSGLWSSKIGTDIDALHLLEDFVGVERYGEIYTIFAKPMIRTNGPPA